MQDKRRVPVWAFVDWNSQVCAVQRITCSNKEPRGRDVLEFVVQRISNELKKFPRSYLFEIRIRAYCGWHKGFEPTPRRKALGGIREEEIFDLCSQPNMTVRQLLFGDQAAGALDKRLSRGTNSHYPATCRERSHNRHEEKMVDTALVSDLVYHAIQPDSSWLLVIGEDVDLIPGIYTAEAIIAKSERKIAYLWAKDEKYLVCDDLKRFQTNIGK